MGHYTGHCFRLILKADTPQNFIDLIQNDILKSGSSEPTSLMTQLDNEVIDAISYLTRGVSAYLDGWCKRELTRQEDGTWKMLTYASTRSGREGELLTFLAAVHPYLAMNDGDIVYREIYESAHTEDVIYLKDGVFERGDGWRYVGGQDNEDHPWNSEEGGELFEPPWNYYDIVKAIGTDVKN